MEDGSDAHHVRAFWDTAHGNELASHDLQELAPKSARRHRAERQEQLF